MSWFFWRTKETDSPLPIRNSNYRPEFKRNEELPLEVWTYLVKRRAGFKCEGCGTKKTLQSHHIKPVYQVVKIF